MVLVLLLWFIIRIYWIAVLIYHAGSTNLNVAFTAVPSKAYSYKAGDIIRFDTIKTNVGNGFNNGTYRFTAPSAGMYVFSWSLAIPSNNRGQHNLMINGHGYQILFCQHSYQQCGSTVTVSLKKYDQVWIKCLFDKIHIYGHYSSFSGWRLF